MSALAFLPGLAEIGGVRPAVPIQFMRVVLGLLAMFFAYALGRTLTRLHNAGQPKVRALTWVLRTVVALGAIVWTRGLDPVGIVLIALAAVSLAVGVYLESRPHESEEIHLFTEK